MCIAACGITAIEGDAMRLINNGAICAVKSKEQRRLERFRAAQSRKERNNEKPRMAVKSERVRSDSAYTQEHNATQMRSASARRD